MDSLTNNFIKEILSDKTINNNSFIQLLKILFDNNSFGLAIYHNSGQCVYCNDKGAAIIGGERKTILEHNFRNVESWKKTNLLELALNCLESQKSQISYVTTKSSFEKNITIKVIFHYWELNLQPHLILIVEDHSVENSLRNKLKDIMDNMPIGLGVTDKNYHIIDSNSFFEKLIGYSKSELFMKSVLDITHPDDREKTNQFSSSLLPTKSDSLKYEKRYICKNGEIKWVRVIGRSSKVLEEYEDYQSFVTVEDITIEKQKEAELKRLNELAELQRTQLMNAAKMSALGEMAAGLAHEVNNPLAIISLKLAKLKKMFNEEVLLKYPNLTSEVEKIEFVVFRIAKIIRGLKTFSRKSENDPKELYSITQLINESIELCSNRIDEAQVQLAVHIDKDEEILCRPVQLSQVIINLISNSIDAISNFSNRWIKIQVTHLNDILEIRIIDAGLGVDAEIVDKIMNPFFTSKEIGKGTGLGLSISKGIIEDHEGELKYELFENHTSFSIRLKLNNKI